eukprot:5861515-Amphidinium_carterae.1
MAKWNSPLIAGKSSSSGSDALDRTLWDDVLEEVKKRLADRPEKIRAIDDLSESQVNAAYAMNSKVDLMSIDVMGTLCRLIFKAVVSKQFSLRLSTGSERVYIGVVHDEWYLAGALPQLMGRVFDLKDAYKQLCVSERSLKYAGSISGA